MAISRAIFDGRSPGADIKTAFMGDINTALNGDVAIRKGEAAETII